MEGVRRIGMWCVVLVEGEVVVGVGKEEKEVEGCVRVGVISRVGVGVVLESGEVGWCYGN